MDNLKLYDAVRAVPENAQRTIAGGRLVGKTDINPMWRIKTLTEQFGACGFGWKTVIKKMWQEQGADRQIAAFVEIDLFVKHDGQWSEPIPGIGGSMFIEKNGNGLYTSDECFKMAYTDAISVACKALGMGADIYWGADRTKYDNKGNGRNNPEKPKEPVLRGIDDADSRRRELAMLIKDTDISPDKVSLAIKENFGKDKASELTGAEYLQLYKSISGIIGK